MIDYAVIQVDKVWKVKSIYALTLDERDSIIALFVNKLDAQAYSENCNYLGRISVKGMR